ncbi:hypothetical protein QTN25_001335 [Entamoeba marina]
MEEMKKQKVSEFEHVEVKDLENLDYSNQVRELEKMFELIDVAKQSNESFLVQVNNIQETIHNINETLIENKREILKNLGKIKINGNEVADLILSKVQEKKKQSSKEFDAKMEEYKKMKYENEKTPQELKIEYEQELICSFEQAVGNEGISKLKEWTNKENYNILYDSETDDSDSLVESMKNHKNVAVFFFTNKGDVLGGFCPDSLQEDFGKISAKSPNHYVFSMKRSESDNKPTRWFPNQRHRGFRFMFTAENGTINFKFFSCKVGDVLSHFFNINFSREKYYKLTEKMLFGSHHYTLCERFVAISLV